MLQEGLKSSEGQEDGGEVVGRRELREKLEDGEKLEGAHHELELLQLKEPECPRVCPLAVLPHWFPQSRFPLRRTPETGFEFRSNPAQHL